MVSILWAPEERGTHCWRLPWGKIHPLFALKSSGLEQGSCAHPVKGGKAAKLREVKQTHEHSQPSVQDPVLRGSPHQIKSSLRTALALPLDLSVCSLGDKPWKLLWEPWVFSFPASAPIHTDQWPSWGWTGQDKKRQWTPAAVKLLC